MRFTCNFDQDPAGRPPQGFQVILGRWVVEADPSAPTPPHVLAQRQPFPVGLHFPRCLVDGVTVSDFIAQVAWKPLDGQNDQAGGILFHAQDPETYYVFRANLLDDLALFKAEGGTRRALGRFQARGEDWQMLRVEVRGTEIRCSWNGRLVIRVDDGSFRRGGIGLWTIADSISAFDDLTIEAPGAS